MASLRWEAQAFQQDGVVCLRDALAPMSRSNCAELLRWAFNGLGFDSRRLYRNFEHRSMSDDRPDAQLNSPDPGTDSMFERTLQRTPAQRLADAARIAWFVLRGREKISAAIEADGSW